MEKHLDATKELRVPQIEKGITPLTELRKEAEDNRIYEKSMVILSAFGKEDIPHVLRKLFSILTIPSVEKWKWSSDNGDLRVETISYNDRDSVGMLDRVTTVAYKGEEVFRHVTSVSDISWHAASRSGVYKYIQGPWIDAFDIVYNTAIQKESQKTKASR